MCIRDSSTIVMTLLVLTFGEILPKSIAKEYAESFSLKVASVLWGIMTVLKPLVWLFVQLKALVMKPFRSKENAPSMTEEELKYMIEEIEDEGVLEEHESELLQSAMEFTDITVSEIITHRVDVVAVDIREPVETVKNVLLTERFARIPVYDKKMCIRDRYLLPATAPRQFQPPMQLPVPISSAAAKISR